MGLTQPIDIKYIKFKERKVYIFVSKRYYTSEVSVMCNLSKGVEEKGIVKGILSSIENLMESMGWSAEQAMDALKIPKSDREQYTDKLKK